MASPVPCVVLRCTVSLEELSSGACDLDTITLPLSPYRWAAAGAVNAAAARPAVPAASNGSTAVSLRPDGGAVVPSQPAPSGQQQGGGGDSSWRHGGVGGSFRHVPQPRQTQPYANGGSGSSYGGMGGGQQYQSQPPQKQQQRNHYAEDRDSAISRAYEQRRQRQVQPLGGVGQGGAVGPRVEPRGEQAPRLIREPPPRPVRPSFDVRGLEGLKAQLHAALGGGLFEAIFGVPSEGHVLSLAGAGGLCIVHAQPSPANLSAVQMLVNPVATTALMRAVRGTCLLVWVEQESGASLFSPLPLPPARAAEMLLGMPPVRRKLQDVEQLWAGIQPQPEAPQPGGSRPGAVLRSLFGWLRGLERSPVGPMPAVLPPGVLRKSVRCGDVAEHELSTCSGYHVVSPLTTPDGGEVEVRVVFDVDPSARPYAPPTAPGLIPGLGLGPADDGLCVVCMDRPREVGVKHHGQADLHLCLCVPCSAQLMQPALGPGGRPKVPVCPMCRAPVEGMLKVYQ